MTPTATVCLMSRTAKRPSGGDSVNGNAHRLGRNHLDDGSVTRLDVLRRGFNGLARATVDLLEELAELAGNVGSVAVQDWSVTSTDLARVVQDDDLGVEA